METLGINLFFVLIGFVLGILASIAAGVRLSFLQFKSSIAGYRVQMVTDATLRIHDATIEDSYVGTLLDRYRFSLGVILEELEQKFGRSDFNNDGGWPLLIDYDESETKKDRWWRFIHFVRPVIDDINVYAFVAGFPRQPLLHFFFGWLYDRAILLRLGKLTELCHQLETVVGELDAAFEANQDLAYVKDRAIFPNAHGAPEKITALTDEFKKLHGLWLEWLDLVLARA
ncbi:MAG: hypothetical protein IT320_09450 [Anaerolineae bacterium]|nr:hypothetical protein [Anaerolineae bacterium]